MLLRLIKALLRLNTVKYLTTFNSTRIGTTIYFMCMPKTHLITLISMKSICCLIVLTSFNNRSVNTLEHTLDLPGKPDENHVMNSIPELDDENNTADTKENDHMSQKMMIVMTPDTTILDPRLQPKRYEVNINIGLLGRKHGFRLVSRRCTAMGLCSCRRKTRLL